MNNNKKIKSIVAIRALAVLMVMLFHFSANETLSISSSETTRLAFGHFGVALFFIVSGFVLPYSLYKYDYRLRNFFSFLYKRVIRIEPPYIVSIFLTLIAFLAKDMVGQKVNYSGGLTGVISQFVYLNDILHLPWTNIVYWTLAIEFQFYLLIGLIFPILKKLSGNKLLYALLLIVSSKLIVSDNIWILYYLPFFTIGYGLCAAKLKILNRPQLFALITLSLIINTHSNSTLYSCLDLIITLFFILIYYMKDNSFSAKFLFIGEISYSLYLIHNIFVASIPVITTMLKIDNLILKISISSILFIVAIAMSYLFFRLIERPFHKKARSISIGG